MVEIPAVALLAWSPEEQLTRTMKMAQNWIDRGRVDIAERLLSQVLERIKGIPRG